MHCLVEKIKDSSSIAFLLFRMTKGCTVSTADRVRIRRMLGKGRTQKEVAEDMGFSRATIRKYQNDNGGAAPAKKRGRPMKVDDRTARWMARALRKSKTTSLRSVQAEAAAAGYEYGRSTIGRAVHMVNPDMQYSKGKKRHIISAVHKRKRLAYARQLLKNPPNWDNVIFLDEKRWGVATPDGCSKFWCLKGDKKAMQQRGKWRGDGVMLWGGIAARGTTSLEPTSTSLDGAKYRHILSKALLPVGEAIAGAKYLLVQDGAPAHRSNACQRYLKNKEIRLLTHPPSSPDLNPMENCWGYLTQQVYRREEPFRTLSELREALQVAWNGIDKAYLSALVHSMPDRLREVVRMRGEDTRY